MEGPGGLKALAKLLVSQFALGVNAARFSVVSFASDATIRLSWSYDYASINAGIDEMTAYGRTSISDGFEAAGQLFDGGREGVSKFVLFISDGDQTVDAAPGKSLLQTAVDAATLVKGDGVTVFAWGIGKASLTTLEEIAIAGEGDGAVVAALAAHAARLPSDRWRLLHDRERLLRRRPHHHQERVRGRRHGARPVRQERI